MKKIRLAEELISKMEPCTYLFTLLMNGYAKNNQFNKAKILFEKMLKSKYF